MKKSPPFDWQQFLAELAADPHFDPFAKYSFHEVSRYDRQQIAERVMAARLAATTKKEHHQ